MKRIFVTGTGLLLFVTQFAYGQGSILFQNVGPGLTTQGQVRDMNGVLIPAGNAFTAELLAGTSASSLAPFATPITTSVWAGNGWFGVGQPEKVLPGFAPGSLPFLSVRVWENAGGTITSFAAAQAAGLQYGISPLAWQLPASTGGLGNPTASPPVPGPALIGMGGGPYLVPEPSTITLVASGLAVLLSRRRK